MITIILKYRGAATLDVNTATEGKILDATIQCIERYGLDGTTIRRIAETAGVNSAAISYYYRSKDRLVEKAMELSLANAFDWDDYPDVNELSLQEYLTNVFIRLVEGSQTFPGLTRAHFFGVFARGEYGSPSIKKINQFFEELLGSIMKKYPGRDEAELRKALTQMASAAFLVPSLMPGLFHSFCPVDFKSKVDLKAYIRRIVESLLKM